MSNLGKSNKTSYVTVDGNYGSDEVLLFDYDSLTKEQWELLGELPDEERIKYVRAIISGKKNLSRWEDYGDY